MRYNKKIVLFVFILIASLTLVYFLFLYKPIIKPSTCFNHLDREIVVLANKKIDVDSLLKGPSSNFFRDIQHKIKFKKVYISLQRPKILFSFNQELTSKKFFSIINSLGLKYNSKNTMCLFENKWNCQYYGNYLFFFKGKLKSNKSDFFFDQTKADLTIYKSNDKSKTDFILTKKNILKVSQNKFSCSFLNKNDFIIFNNTVPKTIDNYTFFEKKFAQKRLIIEKGTAFHKIIDKGFCIFKFKGNEYILAEKRTNCDPYKVFDYESGINEIIPGLRKKYQNIFLTSETPKLNNQFYLDLVNDKLLFCQSKEQYEEILAFISKNNSNTFSFKEFKLLFDRQPYKVVYRKYNSNSKVSICFNRNDFHEYISSNNKLKKSKIELILKNEDIKQIVGGNTFIFVFTLNEIIKLKYDKILERVKFKGELIGVPEIYEVDKEDKIFFTTSEKLYFLNQNFKPLKGFPIILKNKPEIPFQFVDYKQSKFIGYSNKKIFSICDSFGNVIEKMKLDLDNINQPVSFFKTDDLYGIIHDNKTAQFLDLERNKILNRIILNNDKSVFLTNNKYQAFYYIENNKLIRNDFNGELKKCASGKKLFNLKSFPKNEVVGVLSTKNLVFFDINGDCVSKIKLPVSTIKDYLVIQSPQGSSYIIMIDDLSNEIYIYTFDGETVLNSTVKGSKTIFINGIGSDIQIYTVFQKKMIKYLI